MTVLYVQTCMQEVITKLIIFARYGYISLANAKVKPNFYHSPKYYRE